MSVSDLTGIQERVADARLLWDAGRREGGFLMALTAISARARQDWPAPIGDRDAFERFFRSRFLGLWQVEFRGELRPIQTIFYKWMRCELVHEGGLPVDVRFKEDAKPGECSFRAGGAPEYTLLVSPDWFELFLAWASS